MTTGSLFIVSIRFGRDQEIEEITPMRKTAVGITALLLSLHTPAMSANFTINNPAERINNSAGKIYNPASQINNPASNIYNPAAQMDNPNPLSPPTQPVPQPTATKAIPVTIPAEQVKTKLQPKPQPKPAIPQRNYNFKKVGTYIIAANKAFNQDDYLEFISITEDALRRINTGTLKASKNTKQKLTKYRFIGYALLENETSRTRLPR